MANSEDKDGQTIVAVYSVVLMIAFIVARVASVRFNRMLKMPGKLMDDDGTLVKRCADLSIVS